ncbi:Hypothetical protein GLP15_581 [Giardia lamblia P15]|uniref:Uncharacterized protein n=1 Tax=Giardia intestinalis (strain P15) TaxID=658858 RepID=E1F550_GIAIA|nr:Hypothetical protein GLP15_581 [Giardia lamblia P15]
MSWCTLYAASLKQRGPDVETCLIILAHNCYSRLEYTFRVPVIGTSPCLPGILVKELCSFLQAAIEWAANLMNENARLAAMGIGDVHYFNSLAMVLHPHLDRRVMTILTKIALKHGWEVQNLPTRQTFNQEIQHVNKLITPRDLCSLCLDQLGCLQYDNLNKLLSHRPYQKQCNDVSSDTPLREKELERIGRAIANDDILAFRPIFQDPPSMSFCAKTLTELMIAITEEQVCSWNPYDAALYFLLDMLRDYRQDALYFLHQAKSLFPDSLFKTMLISMSSDLQFLLSHLPSPELNYNSAKYLEEDISTHLYTLLQSPSLRMTIYEFAGSFVRLLPFYFEYENIYNTQPDFKGCAKNYGSSSNFSSSAYALDTLPDLSAHLPDLDLERHLVSPLTTLKSHIANRFINQSIPDSVIQSSYFNICYGTRFLTLLNCLTMLLHAKLIMTQMLMTSYESMFILRFCAGKDPVMVESVIRTQIPLSISRREFLIRSLKTNYFIQNIITDICFLKDNILVETDSERCKTMRLIKKELEGSPESSISELCSNPQEVNIASDEAAFNDTDADYVIDASLHVLESIDICSSTDEDNCIEDDISIDESLFRAAMPSSNLSLPGLPLQSTQGYHVRHKNVQKVVCSVFSSIKKKSTETGRVLDRPQGAVAVVYARSDAIPILRPVIQDKTINIISRILKNCFT